MLIQHRLACSNPRSSRPLCLALLHSVLLLVASACCPLAGQSAPTTVYRCPGEDGTVEFRQVRCDGESYETVTITDHKVGWEAVGTKAPARAAKKKKKRKKRAPASSAAVKASQAAGKERCFRTRQRLDRVEWRLRKGYKAGQGDKLRRQRREYGAFLREFCRP